jgi:superfamily II DNA/RNA helicase
MLDMGFKPAVDRIVKLCPRDRQTLFFSATLDGDAGKVARTYTEDAVAHEHKPTDIRKAAIEHQFRSVVRTDRVDALLSELKAPNRDLALVFVRTKRGADRLVKKLGAHGVDAVAMHGDKSQRQREKALAGFEAGRVDTLVATDVAARGIDVDGISHVIQFDPPEDSDTYTHRVGRTGRAGRTGIGVTFVDAEQAADVAKIARALKLDDEFAHSGLVGAVREQHTGGHRGKPAKGSVRGPRAGGRPSTAGRHGGSSQGAKPGSRRRSSSSSSRSGGGGSSSSSSSSR